MRYFIYILQCEITGRYYCGQTGDLEDRLSRHNGGMSKSTKSERPWILGRTKEVATRSEAVRLETHIKKCGIRRFMKENNIIPDKIFNL